MRTNYLILGIIALFGFACGTAQLNQAEDRDKIATMVSNSKSDLVGAQEEYRNLSDEFSSFVMFSSSDLQSKYRSVQNDYDDAQDYHEDIQYWIREVDERFSSFSRNWRDSLDEFGNSDLRSQSLSNLQQSQRQYQNFYQAMQSTEMQMQQILDEYDNLFLFISQNLNQTSLANIEGDANNLRQQTSNLERQIEQTIQEADNLIRVLENSQMYRDN